MENEHAKDWGRRKIIPISMKLLYFFRKTTTTTQNKHRAEKNEKNKKKNTNFERASIFQIPVIIRTYLISNNIY